MKRLLTRRYSTCCVLLFTIFIHALTSADSSTADSSTTDTSKTGGPADIFFVQMSDTHVYDKKSDFEAYSAPNIPWFIPDFLVPWLTVQILSDAYGEDAIQALRSALENAGYQGDLEEASDTEIYNLYALERAKEPGLFGSLDTQIREALNEVVGFEPEFIINTGDLVLESNNGSPEAIERWFVYYKSLIDDLKIPVYNTIGNNEIAGTQRESFTPDHPKFGKYFFKEHYSQTYFSFDKGHFRFIALDTHSPAPTKDDPHAWSFAKMPPEVSDWLDSELQKDTGKQTVILNHEPFHFDPRWPFDEAQNADDEGLFAKHDVRYVLSGHTHYRSEMTIEGTHHLTAGALSGMRWVLPAALHERGYRMFQSAGKQLFSIWKPTAESIVGFSTPQSDETDTLTIAAIDSNGPFRDVKFHVDNQPIEATMLGRYFFQIPVSQLAGAKVSVTTTDSVGLEQQHLLSYIEQEKAAY